MLKFTNVYDYQEIRIEEIDQIYEIANDYNAFYGLPRQGRGDVGLEHTYLQSFYRGQADATWDVSPSICRNKNIDESISAKGRELYEMIAYRQHYLEPTRLIDFSTDVNVAMYFACCSHKDKDAAVYIWSYSPYDSDWLRVAIQCELVNIQEESISIREFADILIKKYPELNNRYKYICDFHAELVSFMEHGFMVVQSENFQNENIRMKRQKGSLYVCGVKFKTPIEQMRSSLNAGNNIFYPRQVVTPEELNHGDFLVKIIIPADLKQKVMLKLEEEGITEKFLFPPQK